MNASNYGGDTLAARAADRLRLHGLLPDIVFRELPTVPSVNTQYWENLCALLPCATVVVAPAERAQLMVDHYQWIDGDTTHAHLADVAQEWATGEPADEPDTPPAAHGGTPGGVWPAQVGALTLKTTEGTR